ncbi:MAG TPA: 2-amino-3,7-dideoxy-D-threo-hept-6-ulosonate synthase [Nitrososphaeraceae archaeon]|jgi:fructose-bisphosphate aldolase/2-amino-3,7-dideoxy-D-threo-hept-6-ulosonate synthase
MGIGKAIRISRLLNNNRMLCIPLDHGMTNGPISGIENAHKIIYDCENSGLTCIIVNKGIIKSFPRPPNLGIIAHMSSSTSLGPAPNRKMIMGSVEEAIRLGADAVSVHINIGSKEEPEMLQNLGMISDKSTEWNIPLIAMMYPRGENIKNPHDETVVSHVARIGAEAGADIVKTVYTGDPKTFRRVVKGCPVPIVIAGGPKASTDSEILAMCVGAMEAGAIGVTFGRNIFQHRNPRGLLNALSEIIFEGKKPKGVSKELG